MLVHQWSILQRPLLAVIGIHKITTMVICLCKLHNFLLTKKKNHSPQWTTNQDKDTAQGMIQGSIPMEHQHKQEHNNEANVPEQLLCDAEHF